MKKRMGSLLLAGLLAASTLTLASAEESNGLRLSADRQGKQATVQVYLTAEDATNGKIQLHYDTERLVLQEAKAADDSWFVSINDKEEGTVSFAWIASDLAAEETNMLTLTFKEQGGKWNDTVVTGEVTELYESGKVMENITTETEVTVLNSRVDNEGNGNSNNSNKDKDKNNGNNGNHNGQNKPEKPEKPEKPKKNGKN